MQDIIDLFIKSNTLNFIIVVLIVGFLIIKLNIKQKIEDVRNSIKSFVEDSQKENDNARNTLDNINKKITKLPVVIEKIQGITEKNIRNIEQKIHSDIEIQKQDIENNAKRLFNLETKKFKSKLTNILSEKSIEMVKENARKQLSENKSLHDVYIDNAISELDRVDL